MNIVASHDQIPLGLPIKTLEQALHQRRCRKKTRMAPIEQDLIEMIKPVEI